MTSSGSVNWGAKPVAMEVRVLEGGHGAVPAACEVQAMVEGSARWDPAVQISQVVPNTQWVCGPSETSVGAGLISLSD